MSTLDWTLVACYSALLVGVALYFRRRASRGVEDYFLADRNLSWWVIGLSDSAAYTGGGQGFLMVFFLSGFAGLWLMAWLSWIIWMPLVAVLWARFWRRLGVVTTGELIERRYGGRPARIFRQVYAVYACLAWGLTALAYGAAWMAATIAPMLGWTGGQVLLVFGGLTLFYTLLSGFLAVAYNDVIQFCILLVANTALGVLLVGHVGGLEVAWDRITALRGAGFLSPWPGGDLTLPTVLALCLQGLFFAGSPFAGEGWTAQRYLAARSELHAAIGQIFNGVLALVVRLVPFVLIGLAAASIHRPETVAVPAELWGELVKAHAGPGLFGLLLIAGLGGYMAGLSSIVNWAASYPMNDLYRVSLRPQAGTRELVTVSRLLTGGLLGAALLIGSAIDPKSLDTWVMFINSALVVFPLPLAWLKWFWWRTNIYAEMIGVLGAFPAGYLVWFGSETLGIPAFGNLQIYPFWVGFGILFGLGTVATLLATVMFRPEPTDVLVRFYRDVRPMGWWGPVRAFVDDENAAEVREETRRDLIACGLGLVFYFTLVVGFFSLMGGRRATAAGLGVAAVASGWLFFQAILRAKR